MIKIYCLFLAAIAFTGVKAQNLDKSIAKGGTNARTIKTGNIQFGGFGNAISAAADITSRDTVTSLTIYYKPQFNTSIDKDSKLNLWLENGDVLTIPNGSDKKEFTSGQEGFLVCPIDRNVKERLKNQKVMKYKIETSRTDIDYTIKAKDQYIFMDIINMLETTMRKP